MLEGGGLMCEEEPDQFPRFYFKNNFDFFFLIGVFHELVGNGFFSRTDNMEVSSMISNSTFESFSGYVD